MNWFEIIVAAGFWICAACLLYAYAGYPLLIWWLARRLGRPVEIPAVEETDLPSLSLLIAAYNEEAVIGNTVQTALAMDYPAEKLEIVVASDGSSDATSEIVRCFAGRGVRLLDYRQRRGKASVLNSAFPELSGEIVLLSDANTRIDPAAARRIARWFVNEHIGIVCGRLVLTDPVIGRNVDGLYWKYETFLKRCEGRLGALLGANGAIYAIRRALYAPIPDGTIVDDFVIPLRATLRTGCAIVYDCDAVAHEETPPDMRSEFRRRCRIGAGGFQSMGMLWKLLDPRRGWIAFTFLSHKILRWLCPFFLLGLFATNLVLCEQPFYRYCLLGQVGFFLVSMLSALAPFQARPWKFLRLTAMFTSMNAALLVGFWRWLWGLQKAAWNRTARATIAKDAVR